MAWCCHQLLELLVQFVCLCQVAVPWLALCCSVDCICGQVLLCVCGSARVCMCVAVFGLGVFNHAAVRGAPPAVAAGSGGHSAGRATAGQLCVRTPRNPR